MVVMGPCGDVMNTTELLVVAVAYLVGVFVHHAEVWCTMRAYERHRVWVFGRVVTQHQSRRKLLKLSDVDGPLSRPGRSFCCMNGHCAVLGCTGTIQPGMAEACLPL